MKQLVGEHLVSEQFGNRKRLAQTSDDNLPVLVYSRDLRPGVHRLAVVLERLHHGFLRVRKLVVILLRQQLTLHHAGILPCKILFETDIRIRRLEERYLEFHLDRAGEP